MFRFFLAILFTASLGFASCGGKNDTVNLTVEAQVAPSALNAPEQLQTLETEGECIVSCEVRLSSSSDGQVFFEHSSGHVLSCFNGILNAQSFTAFSGELASSFFAKNVLVEVNCTQEISGSFDVERILTFVYLGEAQLNAGVDSSQTVQVKISSLLDIIFLGLSPQQAFDVANCPTLRFIDALLTASCPDPGQEPPFPEPVPGEGCGNGEVEEGEECDLNPSTCFDLPLFDCVAPGEEAECSCELNSCNILPFLKDEILFSCSVSPKCGDNVCQVELGEPGNCKADCHCGDNHLQTDLGEHCEFGPEGPYGCPSGQECGNPDLSLACQCVSIVRCGAGQVRCAPGSGVGCVIPCDGTQECPDGLDEGACGPCPPGTIQCGEALCGVTCDGNPECPEGGFEDGEPYCGPD